MAKLGVRVCVVGAVVAGGCWWVWHHGASRKEVEDVSRPVGLCADGSPQPKPSFVPAENSAVSSPADGASASAAGASGVPSAMVPEGGGDVASDGPDELVVPNDLPPDGVEMSSAEWPSSPSGYINGVVKQLLLSTNSATLVASAETLVASTNPLLRVTGLALYLATTSEADDFIATANADDAVDVPLNLMAWCRENGHPYEYRQILEGLASRELSEADLSALIAGDSLTPAGQRVALDWLLETSEDTVLSDDLCERLLADDSQDYSVRLRALFSLSQGQPSTELSALFADLEAQTWESEEWSAGVQRLSIFVDHFAEELQDAPTLTTDMVRVLSSADHARRVEDMAAYAEYLVANASQAQVADDAVDALLESVRELTDTALAPAEEIALSRLSGSLEQLRQIAAQEASREEADSEAP
jgi:hypothetical protein